MNEKNKNNNESVLCSVKYKETMKFTVSESSGWEW
jgi:hypothetical protein